MVSTARKKNRSPSGKSQDIDAWKGYEETIASVTHSKQGLPSASELFAFMFDTDKIPAQTAQESEDLLTRVMAEDKIWAWTEVDSPSAPITSDGTNKMVGALGVNPDNTSSFSVVDLKDVHARWKSAVARQPDVQHPLMPIIQAWHDLEAN